MTDSSTAPTQFFMRPLVHATFLGIMGAFVALGLALAIAGDADTRSAGGIIAGLMLSLTASLYLPLIWYQRVKLTSAGIMARALGCTVAADWNNLEQFTLRPNGTAGIVTRTPMTGTGVERLRRYRNLGTNGMPRYDEDERQWFLEGRYIPLQGFDHAVRSGALQRALAAHVPHLPGLAVDPQAQAEIREASAAARRMPAWFWVAMAALVGGSMLAAYLVPPEAEGAVGRVVGTLACGLASLRVGYSAFSCWRGRLRLLAALYAVLAVMLALLALAALGSGTT